MRTEKGFTLVEMAFVLIIFGMITTAVFTGYKIYNIQAAEAKTVKAMKAVEFALMSYKSSFKRYPCPADPTKRPSDDKYGEEDCTNDTGNIVIVTPPASHGRDTSADKETTTSDRVMIGAIPIVTLMKSPISFDRSIDFVDLSNAITLDGYGRKLKYAVSEYLTCGTGWPHCQFQFHEANGAIDIVDENRKSTLAEKASAHFVLISHGENGRGAYLPDGKLVSSCGSRTPATGGETETQVDEWLNCINLGYFANALHNNRRHSFNDDTTRATLNQMSGIWLGMSNNRIRNLNAGFIGIGTNAKNPEQQLQLDGMLKSTTIKAAEYCDENKKNCIPANIFSQATMKCQQEGYIVKRIQENKVECEPAFPVGTSVSCPAGPPRQFLNGIRRLDNGTVLPICCTLAGVCN